jgi:NitT/TauT family transport system substrate-binding protein
MRFFSFALLLLFSFCSCKKEETVVKIGYLPYLNGLPFYLALEKGYFKEEGLNVQSVRFEVPNPMVDALLAGQLDFTSPASPLLTTAVVESKSPGKFKIYALSGGTEEIPIESFLVKKENPISKLQDLKGKKIGIIPGLQPRIMIHRILEQNNFQLNDFEIIEIAANMQIQALQTNQIDALLALEPIPTILKNKNLGKEIIHAPAVKYIANPFYLGAGAVRVEFAKKNPEITAKILRVFEKVIREIQEKPDEARQYFKGYTPLENSLLPLAPVLTFKMDDKLSAVDISAAQKFLDLCTDYQIVNQKINFESLLFSTK